jgi:hypothetical protein
MPQKIPALPTLPGELHNKIWEFACFNDASIIRVRMQDPQGQIYEVLNAPSLSGVLQATRDSSAIALKYLDIYAECTSSPCVYRHDWAKYEYHPQYFQGLWSRTLISPKRPVTFFYANVQSDAFYILFLDQRSPRPPSMTPIGSRITRLHVSSNYEQRSSNAPGSSQNETVYAMSGVRRQPPTELIKPLFSHIRNLALNLSLGTFYREYFRVAALNNRGAKLKLCQRTWACPEIDS